MADEELKKKKKIIVFHKGRVTKTLVKVQALLDAFESSVTNQVRTYGITLTENCIFLVPWTTKFRPQLRKNMRRR